LDNDLRTFTINNTTNHLSGFHSEVDKVHNFLAGQILLRYQ